MSDQGKDFRETLRNAQAKLEKRRQEEMKDLKMPDVVEQKQPEQKKERPKLIPPPPGSMPKQSRMPLPGFEYLVPKTPKGTAPIGNHIARTNLFSPTRRGRRKYLNNVALKGPSGAEISFTGIELDMGDQDVALHCYRLARGAGPNSEVKISRYAFLKSIGRTTGNRDYEWLKDSFSRITKGHIDIKTKYFEASYPLIGPLLYDKKEGVYYFSIPKQTMELFKGGFAYINMDRRLMLKGQSGLAKWIQSYAATHKKGEHKIKAETLYNYLQYEMRMRQFKQNLENALDELVRVEELKEWSWLDEEKTTVRWVRS
jgi:hypothetical protein